MAVSRNVRVVNQLTRLGRVLSAPRCAVLRALPRFPPPPQQPREVGRSTFVRRRKRPGEVSLARGDY